MCDFAFRPHDWIYRCSGHIAAYDFLGTVLDMEVSSIVMLCEQHSGIAFVLIVLERSRHMTHFQRHPCMQLRQQLMVARTVPQRICSTHTQIQVWPIIALPRTRREPCADRSEVILR